MIVLRGPGGFPLLGADAIGSWRGNSNARVASWAEEGTQQPADSPAADPAESQELLLAANGIFPPADRLAGTEADAETGARRSRDWLWGTLSSGLGTVTLLTLNALFSNPIAGYDVLPSRLDTAGASGRGPVAARRNQTSAGFSPPGSNQEKVMSQMMGIASHVGPGRGLSVGIGSPGSDREGRPRVPCARACVNQRAN